MVRWFINLLYGSVPAEFHCPSGIPESVRQLQALIGQPGPSPFPSWEPYALGAASRERVYLYKVTPSLRNSFKPFFFGKFEVRSGQVLLIGRFALHPAVRASLTLWFGAVFAAIAFLSLKAIVGSVPPWAPLFGLLLLAGGIAVLQIGKQMASTDARWLSGIVQEALENVPPNNSFKADGVPPRP